MGYSLGSSPFRDSSRSDRNRDRKVIGTEARIEQEEVIEHLAVAVVATTRRRPSYESRSWLRGHEPAASGRALREAKPCRCRWDRVPLYEPACVPVSDFRFRPSLLFLFLFFEEVDTLFASISNRIHCRPGRINPRVVSSSVIIIIRLLYLFGRLFENETEASNPFCERDRMKIDIGGQK